MHAAYMLEDMAFEARQINKLEVAGDIAGGTKAVQIK